MPGEKWPGIFIPLGFQELSGQKSWAIALRRSHLRRDHGEKMGTYRKNLQKLEIIKMSEKWEI